MSLSFRMPLFKKSQTILRLSMSPILPRFGSHVHIPTPKARLFHTTRPISIPQHPYSRWVSRFFLGTTRKLKMDDFLAIFSWLFVGNSLFVLIGTTSFVSTLLFLSNSLQFQEYVAYKIGEQLTKETGFKVTFESAIVPKWEKGVIRLQNVSLLCNKETWLDILRKRAFENGLADVDEESVDMNWTYWDIKIQQVDVTLSLLQWFDGRGLVHECKMKGVRGDIIRDHIVWHDDWVPVKRKHRVGDFELDKFVVEDMLVTIHNPNFRPFNVSVFYGECPKLREQWILYDLLSADSIVGTYDDCLFSVHRPHLSTTDESFNAIKSSVLKVSGVPIEHINTGVTGPFSWIRKGLVDIDLNITIPQTNKDSIITHIKEEIVDIKGRAIDKMEEILQKNEDALGFDTLESIIPQKVITEPVEIPQIEMKWQVKLKGLKASIPLQSADISLWNNATMRPVIAYMNANKTLIPFSFTVSMNMENFNGAWTIYDSKMVDVLSTEIGTALYRIVMEERKRGKLIRRVGIWSIQSVTRNVLSVFDYAYHMRLPLSIYGYGHHPTCSTRGV